jgi:hypothetical protein
MLEGFSNTPHDYRRIAGEDYAAMVKNGDLGR